MSLPGFSRLDRHGTWDIRRTLLEACGAAMLVVVVIDAWALIVGRLM